MDNVVLPSRANGRLGYFSPPALAAGADLDESEDARPPAKAEAAITRHINTINVFLISSLL
jgi:hypothetical protein